MKYDPKFARRVYRKGTKAVQPQYFSKLENRVLQFLYPRLVKFMRRERERREANARVAEEWPHG